MDARMRAPRRAACASSSRSNAAAPSVRGVASAQRRLRVAGRRAGHQADENPPDEVARLLDRPGHEDVPLAGLDELDGLRDGALAARAEVGGGQGRPEEALVDRDVPDRRARHEVGKLRRAREARPLLEDAVDERGGRVEAAERVAKDEPDLGAVEPRRARLRLEERLVGDHGAKPRRTVEPTCSRRVEVRREVDCHGARRRRLRSVDESASGLSVLEAARGQRGHARHDDATPRARERRPELGLGQDEHRVHPPEAERVRQGGADARRAPDVKDVNEAARVVGLLEAHGRKDDLVLHRERREDRLGGPRRAEHVADLPLRARDRDAQDVRAERALERRRLHRVVQRGRGPVGVHVVDLARREPARPERSRNDAGSRRARRLGVRDVVRLGADGPAAELGDGRRAAGAARWTRARARRTPRPPRG